MRLVRSVVVAAVVTGAVMGCGVPFEESCGSLAILLRPAMGERTIGPDLDLELTEYVVEGSGPGDAAFSAFLTPPGGVVERLRPGTWSIAVTGRNENGVSIGAGEATAEIAAGVVTTTHLTIRPLIGTGRFYLEIVWPPDAIGVPGIDAELDFQGLPTSLECDLAADNASFTYPRQAFPDENVLDAGYYLMTIVLYDGAIPVWDHVEAVRIMADRSTVAAYHLDSVTPNEGSLELVGELEMENPISVSLTGEQTVLPTGGEMTVSAETSQPVDSYQWYINALPLAGETMASLSIGPALVPGTYRLYVVVREGAVVGSEGFEFVVLDDPPFAEGSLVINEIDYDCVGTDSGEFIELYNGGSGAFDLADTCVILFNGATSAEYARFDLAGCGTLEPDHYLLIAGPDVAVPSDVPSIPSTEGAIQNGPDGLAVVDLGEGKVLDALCYEGEMTAVTIDGLSGTFSLVEGVATTAADVNDSALSLARMPNGADTDNAIDDWQAVAPTPGTANE
jgi:hypothetical protein